MESSVDTFGNETSPAAFAVHHREVGERTCVVSVEGDLDLAAAPRLNGSRSSCWSGTTPGT
jgi:hypothetical protein